MVHTRLASTSTGSNVRSVVIDGRLVMREREFLTIDAAEVRAGLDRHVPALMKRFDAAIR